jgi:hypothetical protein
MALNRTSSPAAGGGRPPFWERPSRALPGLEMLAAGLSSRPKQAEGCQCGPLDSRIVTHARRAISFADAAGARCSRSPVRAARDVAPGPAGRACARPGPHHGPLRQRRSTRYSASSATATRRKYSTTRSSTVLIVAARKSMTCVLRGPLAVCRCHQEAPRRLVNHRHLPFANRFIAMLHASGAASTLDRGGIPAYPSSPR